jgi:hypothetical protein
MKPDDIWFTITDLSDVSSWPVLERHRILLETNEFLSGFSGTLLVSMDNGTSSPSGIGWLRRQSLVVRGKAVA